MSITTNPVLSFIAEIQPGQIIKWSDFLPKEAAETWLASHPDLRWYVLTMDLLTVSALEQAHVLRQMPPPDYLWHEVVVNGQRGYVREDVWREMQEQKEAEG